MNERIQQLAEQADNFADNKIQMPGEYHPDWHDVRDEKFAELIVRECIKIVEYKGNKSGKDHPVGFNLLDAAQDIKEHFGVK